MSFFTHKYIEQERESMSRLGELISNKPVSS